MAYSRYGVLPFGFFPDLDAISRQLLRNELQKTVPVPHVNSYLSDSL